MSKIRRTPLPWHHEDDMVFDRNGLRIADCHCSDQHVSPRKEEANARYIALACNAHPPMRRALAMIGAAIPHNLLALLATGNDAELATALKRIVDAWNLYAAPILDETPDLNRKGGQA